MDTRNLQLNLVVPAEIRRDLSRPHSLSPPLQLFGYHSGSRYSFKVCTVRPATAMSVRSLNLDSEPTYEITSRGTKALSDTTLGLHLHCLSTSGTETIVFACSASAGRVPSAANCQPEMLVTHAPRALLFSIAAEHLDNIIACCNSKMGLEATALHFASK